MIGRHIIGWTIVNDVLLPHIVPSISQTTIRFVSRISVEIVDFVIDSWRHRIVQRLVIDIIFVITTRVRTTWCTYEPVVLVLALINTDHRGVIWSSRPFLSLRIDQLSSLSVSLFFDRTTITLQHFSIFHKNHHPFFE